MNSLVETGTGAAGRPPRIRWYGSPVPWQAGVVQWSPRAGETAALAVLGLGLALAVVFLDAAGRVLVGAGAVLLLLLAARDFLPRPRLTAGPDGVDVRRLTGGTHLPWARLGVHVREI